MDKTTKTGLKIFGAIVLFGVGLLIFINVIFPIIFTTVLFHSIDKQMAAGQKYMDSLTEKDIQVWIDRTKKYLDEYDPKVDIIDAKPVPAELKQLKILRIDEDSNFVSYVWAGGFDHTALMVERRADGNFQLTACYNDESNRVVWPRTTSTKQTQTNSAFHLIE